MIEIEGFGEVTDTVDLIKLLTDCFSEPSEEDETERN